MRIPVVFTVCVCHCLCALAGFAAEPALETATPQEAAWAVPERGQVPFRPDESETAVPSPFRQTAHTFEFEAERKRTSGPVTVWELRFPSPVVTDCECNNTVYGEYFQPAGPGPFPGVVVLHILGGQFPLSQMIANSLARQNIAALFIKMPYYGERRDPQIPRRMISPVPSETVEGMTQAVLDIRRAATWLAARPEVAGDELGITGISLGGIMSALAGSVDERFRNVAIYLGGGNLAEMIWDSSRPQSEKFRKDWLDAGGDRQSFLRVMASVDPVTYAARLKDRRVLMVAATEDEIIPKAATLALWNAIGAEPELVWLDAGHITAARYIFGEVQRLTQFFGQQAPARQDSAGRSEGP